MVALFALTMIAGSCDLPGKDVYCPLWSLNTCACTASNWGEDGASIEESWCASTCFDVEDVIDEAEVSCPDLATSAYFDSGYVEDTGSGIIESCTDEATRSDPEQGSFVYAHCVNYTSDMEVLGPEQLTPRAQNPANANNWCLDTPVPSASGELYPNSSTFYAFITSDPYSYDPTAGYSLFGLCDVSDGGGSPYQGAGAWQIRWVPWNLSQEDCDEVTPMSHMWLDWDDDGGAGYGGVVAVGDQSVLGCGVYPPPQASFAESTPMSCTAGSATFDLLPIRRMVSSTGVESIQVTPVARTNAQFPERAWLRGLEIDDWGSATGLVVTDDGRMFSATGNPQGSVVVSSPTTQVTLPVGETRMGSAMTVTGSSLVASDLPVVDLSWTCEVNPENPHFSTITNRQSYIANLSGYGVNHRLLFHLDTTNQMLEIAQVGRYQDRLITHYDSQGRFVARLPFAAAQISGNLAPSGNQLEIEQGLVVYDDGQTVEIEVTGVLLNPLP